MKSLEHNSPVISLVILWTEVKQTNLDKVETQSREWATLCFVKAMLEEMEKNMVIHVQILVDTAEVEEEAEGEAEEEAQNEVLKAGLEERKPEETFL